MAARGIAQWIIRASIARRTHDGAHHSGASAVQDGVPSRARGLNHRAGTPAANIAGTYRTIGASSDSYAPFGRSRAHAPVGSVNPSSSHCARINEVPPESKRLFLLSLSMSGDAETSPDMDRWIGGGAAGDRMNHYLIVLFIIFLAPNTDTPQNTPPWRLVTG